MDSHEGYDQWFVQPITERPALRISPRPGIPRSHAFWFLPEQLPLYRPPHRDDPHRWYRGFALQRSTILRSVGL